MSNHRVGSCIDGGKPSCPLCPVRQKCLYGMKVAGKNEREIARGVKAVMWFDRWSNGYKRKDVDVPASMSPSEAGKALSKLAVAKRKAVVSR